MSVLRVVAIVLLVGFALIAGSPVLEEEIGGPKPADASPSLSGVKAARVPNGNFAAAGYGLLNLPSNHDFEAAPSVVSTPTNYGFDTGSLANWTTSGTVSVQSGGPSGSFARLGSWSSYVRSDGFTVASDADTFTAQVSTSGDYWIKLRVRYGTNYSQTSEVSYICSSNCQNGWKTFTRDAVPFRGQSIKVEVFRNVGSNTLDVDNVGVFNAVGQGWNFAVGTAVQRLTGGPTGAYFKINDQNTSITSDAMTLDVNVQNLRFDARLDAGVGYKVYILSGTNFSTSTEVYAESGVSANFATKIVPVDQFAGQAVKLRFTTGVQGKLSVDNAGQFSSDVLGWHTNDEYPLILKRPGDPSGPHTLPGQYIQSVSDISSEPMTLTFPSLQGSTPVTWFRICYVMHDNYNAQGTDIGSVLQVFWNSTVVFQASGKAQGDPYDPVHTGLVKYFSIPNSLGATGTFTIKGLFNEGNWHGPDVSCLERVDAQSPDPLLCCAKDPGQDSPDPVDLVTGTFSHSHTDISIPAKGMPLDFTRYYSSESYPDDPNQNSPLGGNWSHNWQYSLEAFNSGDNVLIRGPGGSTIVFSKSGGNFVPTVGVEATLVQNGGSWFMTANSQHVYEFNGSGQLVSITDRNGNATTMTYSSGLLTTVTDASGRDLTLAYNGDDRIESVTDELSRTVQFDYDADGNLVEVTDVKAGTVSYEYQGHLLTVGTDANGHDFVTNLYDPLGRVSQQYDALDNLTTFAYSTPGDGATRMTDARGNETTYYFDAGMRVTDIEDDNGGVTTFTFDSDNNRTCVTDPLGNKTGFTYDTKGNVTGIIDANNTDGSCALDTGGVKWTYTYTAKNDVDLATDPLGRQTDFVYDGSGNLTQVLFKDASSVTKLMTCFTRDGDGLITEVIESTTLTDCTGHKTLYDYDTYGNVISIVDPRFSGQGTPPETTMTYDLGGRLLTATNELAHDVTFTYDNQNNVLTVTDELSNVTTYSYDAKGNLQAITDANTNVTSYSYDDADRLIVVTDAESGVTVYWYDAVGNRIAVVNANRAISGSPETACGGAGTGDGVDDDSDTVVDDGCPSTIYAYDNLNRLASETDALGNVWSYAYDAASRISTRTDPKSQAIGYTFDARGDLTFVDYVSGTADVSFDYDALGSRTEMVDGTGTTTYVYDALSRLSSVTFPGSRTVGYGYNNVGDRTSLTYPSTDVATYAYDEAHNLTSVTDWNTDQTTYAYNNAGYLTTATLANGVVGTNTYDNADRLTGIEWANGSVLASVDYTLDAVGNRTERVDGLGTHTYEYDDLYRLTGVTYPGPDDVDYTYDAVGNRLTLVTGAGTTQYAYDAADRISSVTPPGQSAIGYTWDDNGNLTARGSDSFAWDAADRLVSATISSATTTFAYNGDGLRDSLTFNSNTTTFTWDVNRSIPQVVDDETFQYLYGIGRIAQVGSVAMHYYLSDGLGSTLALTDDAGNVVNTYDYDIFGRLKASTGSQPNDFTFTGEQVDDSTGGLQYLRARYYDAGTGTFISRDPLPAPIGAPEAIHRYAYVVSNPATYTDPSGLICLKTSCIKNAARNVANGIAGTGTAIVKDCSTPGSLCVTGAGIGLMGAGFVTGNPGLVLAGSMVLTASDAAQCVSGGGALVCGNAVLGVAGVHVMNLERLGYRVFADDLLRTGTPGEAIAWLMAQGADLCIKYCARLVDAYTFGSGLTSAGAAEASPMTRGPGNESGGSKE